MATAGAPSGVVTFLFTDIEGSTRRWEADAATMGVVLAAHDDVLRAAIEAHGGWLFKHTGDGVCAAFASPRAAVDAAVAAQRALELPVRMGIATGEAELRGDDYFGVALNRAARVMAAGHGGQILLAASTASLTTGIEFVGLGSRRLRDLPNAVEIFQVTAAGLRKEFPPLRTLDPSPGNLRPRNTGLIGRDVELAHTAGELRTHRLVTLTGVGGVGKTRLALEVAGQLADEFPDGVWVFELAAVSDPTAVPDSVAAVLGVTQQPDTSLTDSVAAAQEGRLRLLLFDNCEHVLGATADLIEAILDQSSTVKVLTTSREGLGLKDEQLWPVPSLDVDAGTASAAASLFIERAHSVAPTLNLNRAGDGEAVVEICQRLDGIPLAIELAASRLASMTVQEVQDRLGQRFRLLVGSRRGSERHQTLRHAVAWSYDLLDESETALLERCSVFAGGFDLGSACAVAQSDDDYDILDRLDSLVRKSLLIADPSTGRTRYSMLETIRQFAEDQLVARGDAAAAREAHARHFAMREVDIIALWDGPRQREAYDWFVVELANLRTAFRWAADHHELDVAVAIATYAAFLGLLIARYEPLAWAEELLEPAQAVRHSGLAGLYVLASQCYMAGRSEAAVGYSDAGRSAVNDSLEEVPYGFQSLFDGAYVFAGQPERSIQYLRTQIACGRDAYGFTRATLVTILVITGAYDEAIATVDGLVECAEATRNPHVLAFALLAEGYALRRVDPGRALSSLRRGLMIAQETANRSDESHLAGALCRLEAEHGDPLAALDYFAVAIGNYHDAGNTTTIRVPLAALVTFFDRLGRHERAATIAGFVFSPLTVAWVPELRTAAAHLREVLGDEVYESLAREGTQMTTAEMVKYAYEQIDQARAEVQARG